VSSPGCLEHPELCTAQPSGSSINAALNSPACQGDPLYTPGSPFSLPETPIAGGSYDAGGAPAVILPQSTKNAQGGSAPSGSGTVATSYQTASVKTGGAGALKGAREGVGLGPKGSKDTAQNYKMVSTDLVAAGGVIVASRHNISRGPTSDVQGRTAPSLFVTSSQIIRDRCLSGRLKCPHFK